MVDELERAIAHTSLYVRDYSERINIHYSTWISILRKQELPVALKHTRPAAHYSQGQHTAADFYSSLTKNIPAPGNG